MRQWLLQLDVQTLQLPFRRNTNSFHGFRIGRAYIFTQEKKGEEQYKNSEPELDAVIKEAMNNGDALDRVFFSNIDKPNQALVKMEYASIELVHNSRADEAVKILDSKEYWAQKDLYKDALNNYVEKRKSREKYALGCLVATVDTMVKQNHLLIVWHTRIVYFSTIILVMAVTAVLVFVLRKGKGGLVPTKRAWQIKPN